MGELEGDSLVEFQ